MFRISQGVRLGMLALTLLAQRGGQAPLSIATLAASESLPEPYLQQVLLQLKRGGIVRSIRGAGGGFVLARPPERIRLLDVLQALDGPVELCECSTGGDCTCQGQGVWQRLGECLTETLAGITMADVLSGRERLRFPHPAPRPLQLGYYGEGI